MQERQIIQQSNLASLPLGDGLYLYYGVVNHQAFPSLSGHTFTQIHQSLGDLSLSVLTSEDFIEIIMSSIDIAFSNSLADAPGTSSRMVSSNIKADYESSVIAPREGKIFITARPIPYADLRKAGENGCLIEQAIQLHNSAYLAKHANAWIVSVEKPASIMKHDKLNPHHAFIFFSSKTAVEFIKYTKFYLSRKNKKYITNVDSLPILEEENDIIRENYEHCIRGLYKKICSMNDDEIELYRFEDLLEKKMALAIFQLTLNICRQFDCKTSLQDIYPNLNLLMALLRQYIVVYIMNANRVLTATSEEMQSNLFLVETFKELVNIADTMKESPLLSHEDTRDTQIQSTFIEVWGMGGLAGLKAIITNYLDADSPDSSHLDSLKDRNIARAFLDNLSVLEATWKHESQYITLFTENRCMQTLHKHSILGAVEKTMDLINSRGHLHRLLDFAKNQLAFDIDDKDQEIKRSIISLGFKQETSD
jgi:hypothetical protein